MSNGSLRGLAVGGQSRALVGEPGFQAKLVSYMLRLTVY